MKKERSKRARRNAVRSFGSSYAVALCLRKTLRTAFGLFTGHRSLPPVSACRYLESKFAEDLSAVRSAMERLARSYPPKELAHDAYALYERFRRAIPSGVRGWGAKASWIWG
jgi:hypothetical protein